MTRVIIYKPDEVSDSELAEESEIGEIRLFDTLPEELTYPEIQPHLFRLSERMVKKGTQV